MKMIKRISILILAMMMFMAMATPAFADGQYTQPIDTTNATISMNAFIIVDEYVNILPNMRIGYSIKNASSDESGIKNGIEANKITINGNNSMGFVLITQQTTLQTKDKVIDYPELNGKINDNQKFAVLPLTIDFSNVEYKEPGIYRYSLIDDYHMLAIKNGEDDDVDMEIYTNTRYIDVYVENNDNLDGLKISNIIVYADDEASTKDDSYIYEYKTFDLDLSKILKGNQANMNEKFPFTISINNNLSLECEYTITTSNNETYTLKTNGSGQGSTTIELGHNDIITIHSLPYGAMVSISEVNGDYTAKYTISEDKSEVSSNDGNKIENYEIIKDAEIVFTNTKEGIIPTGVMLSMGPYLGLAIFGIVGLGLTKRKKNI